ncbi:MAG: hypothetical protein ACLPF1_09915 [Methanoregula sp.]|uniref:hypothetical protein n=1 Tax=Methanoregula sp. TaxID=2052170 RepID=UPI003BB16B90
MNLRTTPHFLILAALVMLSLCTCACVNTPGAQATVPTAPPVVSPAVTPGTENTNTTGLVPPPRIICNCPMEPVVSVTLTPIATPDNGLCYCP